MIVCICNQVSDRDIAREAPSCASFAQLQAATGAGLACGCCRDVAHETWAEKRECCSGNAAGFGSTMTFPALAPAGA
jgi:bacterioferritin-associated ferredoxin